MKIPQEYTFSIMRNTRKFSNSPKQKTHILRKSAENFHFFQKPHIFLSIKSPAKNLQKNAEIPRHLENSTDFFSESFLDHL